MQAIREKTKENRSSCQVSITDYGVAYMADGILLFIATSTDHVEFRYCSPWESADSASVQEVLHVISRMNILTQTEIVYYIRAAKINAWIKSCLRYLRRLAAQYTPRLFFLLIRRPIRGLLYNLHNESLSALESARELLRHLAILASSKLPLPV